jgi:hypothetical protein
MIELRRVKVARSCTPHNHCWFTAHYDFPLNMYHKINLNHHN